MTIVVGFVPTAEGEAAMKTAVEEARLREEPILVVNVGQSNAAADPKFLHESGVQQLRNRADALGIKVEVEQFVRGRDAAEEIVDAAERVGAKLIVVGLRRRSATGKLLFGSQAQRILLDAECPVLAVKAPH